MTDPQQQPSAASLQPGRRAARDTRASGTALDHSWIRTVIVAQLEPRSPAQTDTKRRDSSLRSDPELHFRLIRDLNDGVFLEGWGDLLFHLQPPPSSQTMADG